MLTLEHYEQAIKAVRAPTNDKQVDELCVRIADMLEQFKQSQLEVVNELIALYDSASEHNVDVSRDAVYQLARRLAGVDP